MSDISIITPTHNPKWLPEAYESIRHQDFLEWIIVSHQEIPHPNPEDYRVKRFVDDTLPDRVGALKRHCAQRSQGSILVELDHDDLLAPDACHRLESVFSNPDVGFAYSAAADFTPDWTSPPRYNLAHGWQYVPVEYQGHDLEAHQPWPATPASLSRVWYAPNHVRAWRTSVYWAAGGHDPSLSVLDDQDLICRTYLTGTSFALIPDCLYFYRVHGDNTWLQRNSEIQAGTWAIYNTYLEPLILEWTRRSGKLAIDLGGRFGSPPGYIAVDQRNTPIIADLNGTWPLADDSVGVVRAADVFEHLRDPLHTMTELYRVLAPGGYALIQVPSTDGRGAFQDPTHVSWWNENSFLYYINACFARYIDTPVRFQAMRLLTTPADDRGVCWTHAHLVSLKHGYRPPGEIFL